jgi:hypothetical protein
MTGGNQPANIRVINRRFNDPASNNELEDINLHTSFKLQKTKEGRLSFLIDNFQSYQVQGQGVPRIENGAYTSVREYFNSGLQSATNIGGPSGLSPPQAD